MQLVFDANTVAPNTAMEPLPTGWYNAVIEESEMKPTSAGDGHYLNLKFNVIDGPCVGRKFFDRLNLHNKNPVASEIAYKSLSAICHATGVMQIQDTQQLHGRPLQVRLVVKPPSDGYDANNEVKGYRSVADGQKAGGASSGSPFPAIQQAAAPFAPPAAQYPQAAAPQQPAQPAAWAPPQFAPQQAAPINQPNPNYPPPAQAAGAQQWAPPPQQPQQQWAPPAQAPQQFAPPPAQQPPQNAPAAAVPGSLPPWAQPK